MSSIIKKTSSRFAPKVAQRKQSQAGTPNTSKAATPVVQKVVQIEETTQIIPNLDIEGTEEENAQATATATEVFPNLKQNIFESRGTDTNDSTEAAIVDDDDDPKKKSTTVLIHPPSLPSSKTTRSMSGLGAPPSLRRGSVTDDNRRMRRLSSITSGLGSGLLRRPSMSSASSHLNSNAATTTAQPMRISLADTTEPFRIDIPTAKTTRAPRSKTALRKTMGKIPVKRRVTSKTAVPEAPLVVPTIAEDVENEIIEKVPTEDSNVQELEIPQESAIEEEPKVIEVVADKEEKQMFVESSSSETESTEAVQLVAPADSSSAQDSAVRVSPEPTPLEEGENQPRHLKKRQLPISFKPRSEQAKKAKKTSSDPADGSRQDPTFVSPAKKTNPEVLPMEVTSDNLAKFAAFRSTGDRDFQDRVIDDENITMEDLCKPVFPIGQVSEYFDLAKVAAEKKRKSLIERRKLRIQARNKGLSLAQYLEQQEVKKTPSEVQQSSQELQSSLQLQMTQDNKFVVNEESLFVDRHLLQLNDDREKITENAFENPVISSTYGKRIATDKWTTEETKTLYQALSTWGTDFNIITQLFPHRNRRQIKLKFNLEERKHPFIVDLALRRKLPIDFEDYCTKTKQEFKTMDEYNQELKELREKHESEVKQMLEALERQRKEDVEVQRKREVEIRTGVKSMSRAERRAELRKNEIVIGEVVKKQED